jgi:hypothetical protein
MFICRQLTRVLTVTQQNCFMISISSTVAKEPTTTTSSSTTPPTMNDTLCKSSFRIFIFSHNQPTNCCDLSKGNQNEFAFVARIDNLNLFKVEQYCADSDVVRKVQSYVEKTDQMQGQLENNQSATSVS